MSFIGGGAIPAMKADARSSIECRLDRIIGNVEELSGRIDGLADRLGTVLGGAGPESASINPAGPPHSCQLDGALAAIEEGLASKLAKLESVIDRIRL